MTTNHQHQSLSVLLKALRLPVFSAHCEEFAEVAQREGWGFQKYLQTLAEHELEQRRIKRIKRWLKESGLPTEKTLASLEVEKFPATIQRQLQVLCEGHFVDKAQNVLAFGLPGRGKTHLLCAVAHELIHSGRRVLFSSAAFLVQSLLRAKRDLRLERELRRLDRFDVVFIDDIGYIQQDRDEMEVLFTFLAQRYERKSVIITSNLVFSQWDKIFQDPMTTAAAIDRLVHHAIILELTGPSYRAESARNQLESTQAKDGEF